MCRCFFSGWLIETFHTEQIFLNRCRIFCRHLFGMLRNNWVVKSAVAAFDEPVKYVLTHIDKGGYVKNAEAAQLG